MSRKHVAAMKSYLKSAAGGHVQYLILYVTSKCNARCRMCFNWDGMMDRRPLQQHRLEDLVRLARSIKVLPHLTLSGGEPLLRDDTNLILKAFYDYAGTRFFTVPTNALQPGRVSALIERFVEECPEGFLNFCLPFHGPEAVHDDIMGVPGAFQRRNETYKLICAARRVHTNISCVLNCVLSQFNHALYREIVDLAVARFGEAPLGIAYARGKTHEADAVDFPLESYQAMYAYLKEKRKAKGGMNPFTRMQEALAQQYCEAVSGVVEGRIKNIHCCAGRRLLVIHDTGMVYPCETLETPGICTAAAPPDDPCLGDLKAYEYDLSRLLASEKARAVVGWIDANPCSCTWECALTTSFTHTPGSVVRLGAQIARDMAAGLFGSRAGQSQ